MKMQFLEAIRKKAKALKAEINVLSIAYQDKRTPALPKVLIAITVAYMLSPIDLIPDFIPILGLLDDLIIVPALIALSIKLLPVEVLADARTLQAQNPTRLKDKKSWIVVTVIILLWALSLLYGIRYVLKIIH